MAKPLCIVVGYGPGVGHGTAAAFARAGSGLLLLCRRPDKQAALLAELERLGTSVTAQAADAADPEALAAVLRTSLDRLPADSPLVLHYNAVVATAALPSALEPQRLAADLQVDVIGALAAVQAVLPALRQRGGSLLFTGGGMAHHPVPAVASIGIGKAALRNLVLSLAQELADQRPAIGVGMVTIQGQVAAGTAFDPARIGEAFVALQQRLARGEPTAVEQVFSG